MEIKDYLDLITSQYNTSSKFRAWVEVLLTPYIDTQNLASTLYTYFDIDNAIGKQLDMLGKIVGASRVLPFQPTVDSPVLDDETYRFLIKSQIIKNNWDGKNESIYSGWQELHEDVAISIKDNQDMTVSVILIGNLSTIQKEMVEYGMIIPKAQGVKMNYVFSEPPLFSYDQDTDYFKGYDEGNWAEFTEQEA